MAINPTLIKTQNFLKVLNKTCGFQNYCKRTTLRYFSIQSTGFGAVLLRKACSGNDAKLRGKCWPQNWTRYSASRRGMSHQTSESDFIFRQLLEHRSFTLTYLLADKDTKEAILIDPVIDTVDRDVQVIQDLGLRVKYALNTHVHADHITGTGQLKKRLPGCQSVIARVGGAKADVFLDEGDMVEFGKFRIEARSTPGHTNGCMTFIWRERGMAFTGDALLIRGCGRTDFQEGNPDTLYDSVHREILSLPDSFLLYPAHDYTGQTVTTVREEKLYNPRLMKTKQAFVDIMNNLNLSYPKQIDTALPANLACGVYDIPKQDGL